MKKKKNQTRRQKDVDAADGDFDGEALLRAAAEPESFGKEKPVGPEVELVRLDESGVSQAVVAEAPAGRGAAAKATETVARLAADDDDADADDADADDETRLLRGPVTTDAVVVRIARDRDSGSGDENAHALAGLREKGWDAHTVAAASSYAVLAFIAIGYDEILPVFAKTREDLGGLKLSASQIGIVLIVGGVALILFQLFVFPLVLRTLGVTKALRRASLAFAVVAFVAPIASVRGVVENPARKWFVVLFSQILKIVTLAVLFTTVIMAVNNSCMNRVKARVNGFATSCAAAGRIVSPIAHGVVFSFSLRLHENFQQFLVFAFVSASALALFALTSRLPSRLDQPPIEAEDERAVGAEG
jgi:diphthamide biosynthesis protein 2